MTESPNHLPTRAPNRSASLHDLGKLGEFLQSKETATIEASRTQVLHRAVIQIQIDVSGELLAGSRIPRTRGDLLFALLRFCTVRTEGMALSHFDVKRIRVV